MRRIGLAKLSMIGAVFALVTGVAVATAGPAVAAKHSAKPKKGGNLSIGVEAAWTTFDPLQQNNFVSYDIDESLYGSLMQLGDGGKVLPDLATNLKGENGDKAWVITLRKGLKFQDGTPLNAAAVVYNLERVSNPANDCLCYSSVEDIKSVTASGANKITVQLSTPDSTFPSVLAGPPGMMVSPTAAQSEGASYGLHPVGAGPFKLGTVVAGNSATLNAWSGYWDKPEPYLSSVTFKVMTDANTRLSSLQSGVIQDDEDVNPAQLSAVQSNPQFTVTDLGGVGTSFVQFQTQVAPLNNVLAREAINYATNPNQINQALFNGKYTTGIESPFTPQSWAYPGKVKGYQTYNLNKAKALVSQLGGLSFTLTIRANDPISLSEAEALQSQWAQAGIHAQISVLQNVALIQAADKGNYQAMLYRWAGGYDPDQNVFVFFLSGSPTNASQVNDQTVDAYLFQERAATTQSARKKIFAELAQQLALDAPRDYLSAADWWRVSVSTLHGVPNLANNYMQLAGAWMS